VNRYEALKHAVKAHAGQTDKCGKPYILHPIAVAEAIERGPCFPWWEPEMLRITAMAEAEDAIVVALLHDVWEDTGYELPTGPNGQSVALAALTRMPDEPYVEYVERLSHNTLAATVKLADLYHNLQPERQDCLPAKERAPLEKRYLKARDRIWEALGHDWWPE